MIVGITKVRGNANHSQSRGLVESSIRILQTLLRKLLLLSPNYNYEELLFLAPVLLNRAQNSITGFSPYEALYGRSFDDKGIFGSPSSYPRYRLFSESVQKDIEDLHLLVKERIVEMSQRLASEKEKFLSKANKTRLDKPAIPVGEVVFVKDYSIPRHGRARKFRPYYLKSPQIVLEAHSTSVLTLRLADGFISRHHPDDILLFNSKTNGSIDFSFVPEPVLQILGRPLSQSSLIELAKNDTLDLIYVDKILPDYEAPNTRQNKRREELIEMTQAIQDQYESEDDSSSEPAERKTVTFAPLTKPP